MNVLTFGIDNRALLDKQGHSKRWNMRMGKYVNRLDVLVEVRKKSMVNEKYISDNVRIVPVYVSHPILYPIIAYRKALEEHKKYKYSLVATEDPFRTGIAGFLFKRKTNVALSIEYHTDTFYNLHWLMERPIYHFPYTLIGMMVVKSANSIRCVNEKNKRQLEKLCTKRDILIESIPVPSEMYSPDKYRSLSRRIRNKILKNKKDFIILFVGRLVPVKKIEELIQVFSEIRKQYKNAYLLIVGDGPYKAKLQKLAKDLGDNQIIFEGYVDEDNILAYYGAADIFVNPAHVEPYGRVYIEAMSAGLPVVTTSGAGAVQDKLCIHEVNSLIIEPGKIHELNNAISRLLSDDQLRNELGQNAFDIVRRKFDYEKTLQKMKAFWDKTIKLNQRS